MKIIINKDFGGFGINEDVYKACAIPEDISYHSDTLRTNAALISFIETYGADSANTLCSDLAVVEIPDNATDYYIEEYDGKETLLYVVDGKIHFCGGN